MLSTNPSIFKNKTTQSFLLLKINQLLFIFSKVKEQIKKKLSECIFKSRKTNWELFLVKKLKKIKKIEGPI